MNWKFFFAAGTLHQSNRSKQRLNVKGSQRAITKLVFMFHHCNKGAADLLPNFFKECSLDKLSIQLENKRTVCHVACLLNHLELWKQTKNAKKLYQKAIDSVQLLVVTVLKSLKTQHLFHGSLVASTAQPRNHISFCAFCLLQLVCWTNATKISAHGSNVMLPTSQTLSTSVHPTVPVSSSTSSINILESISNAAAEKRSSAW